MRTLGIVLALLLVLAGIGWSQRLDLLMWALPIVTDLRDPIGPTRPVPWPDGPAVAAQPPDERPPNVILVLADDLGFNDVSFTNGGIGTNGGTGTSDGTAAGTPAGARAPGAGAVIAPTQPTPSIDALAREGVVFASGYAANAVCAPSRATLLSGRYSTRFGFEFTPVFGVAATIFEWMNADLPPEQRVTIDHAKARALPPMEALGMPADEVTIAEVLKDAGYYTAHIGKWHLGGVAGMRPEDQGFDDSLYMSGTLYLPPDHPDVVNARRDDDRIERMVWTTARYAAQFNGGPKFAPGGYLTDWYTDQAVRIIEANRNRPFFLYLAHWGIHNPLQALRSDWDALADIADPTRRVYASMIRALDRSVGRIQAALAEHGLERNTLVIFTSDNGGAGYVGLAGLNAPFRGWKLTHFQGGVRVPYAARWPAGIPAGSRFEAPIHHVDLFATIAGAAGAALPQDRVMDSVDLLPFVRGEAAGVPHRTLFWREGHLQTVLHDGWKLMRTATPPRTWLYHLDTDPTEQHDRSAAEPARVAELHALLDAHNAEQAEPLWPSFADGLQRVDRHGAEPWSPGDETMAWPN